MRVFIPDNNQAERIYTLEVLLGTFLGLDFQISEKENLERTILQLENGHSLFIKDSFFNKYKNEAYLKKEAVPSQIEVLEKSPFIVEANLPILFGEAKIANNTNNEIHCEIDLIAASFFMLSRWEEYVLKDRDEHQRFPANASLAYKNNFLQRPIVNEYVELLWNLLLELGIKQKRKKRTFQLQLSHDVDFPLKWESGKKFTKEIAGDILKRKSPSRAFRNVNSFIKSRNAVDSDPYNTFNFLMEVSESINVKSHFFFLNGGQTSYDNQHKMDTPFMLDLYQKIQERGHIIGFHPSYNTYDSSENWKIEYENLKSICPNVQACGRQHFLRFEVPTTWQIWEDNNMDWDSSLGYSEEVGFRSGVCYEYPVFNILTRKKLRLIEKPLILMDVTILLKQKNASPNTCEAIMKKLSDTVKKYTGTFTFLWHNNSFYLDGWKDTKSLYKNLLKIAQV